MKVSSETHEEGNIWGEHLGQACMEVKQYSLRCYLTCQHKAVLRFGKVLHIFTFIRTHTHAHILFQIGQLDLNTASLTPLFRFSILVLTLFRGKIEIKTAFQYLSELLRL